MWTLWTVWNKTGSKYYKLIHLLVKSYSLGFPFDPDHNSQAQIFMVMQETDFRINCFNSDVTNMFCQNVTYIEYGEFVMFV